MTRFPALIRLLLLGSLALTISRAVALPVLAIFLTRHLALDQQQIGLILGVSTLLGTVSGLYGGYLVDRFDRRRLIGGALAVVATSAFALPYLDHAVAVIGALAAADAAVSVVDIAIKAYCADLLPPAERARAFSARYMLTNVGFALGPLLGAYAAGFDPAWPFWLSGALTLGTLLAFAGRRRAFPAATQLACGPRGPDFRATLAALRNDRRLVLFTVGAMLSAIVHARFSAYLSQYLVTVGTPQRAYTVMSSLITANAVVVIGLQYAVGRWIRPDNLMRWIAAGSLLFALGLLGFLHAGSLTAWVAAMVVFTLGEIVVLPAEYLFIDTIAPPHLKGSYYGAQGLANLGGAISPVLCGALLTQAAPAAMFYVLVAAATAGAGLYYLGYRQMRQAATLAGAAR